MNPDALAATHEAAFPGKGWDADAFAGFVASPNHLVAGSEDCFAVLSVVGECAELLSLATHPDRQRQGRARVLLALLHDELRTRGVREVHLEVATDNAAARALYARAGFAQVAERKDYYRRPGGGRVTALILRKDL